MSQADNLAALGSNVNTSGVLQPAGGGTGTTTATGTGSVVLSSGATLTNATINGAVASGFTMKNRIINGDMNIWQRGTSFTGSGSLTYFADRWSSVQYAGSTSTISRQSASGLTGSLYALRAQRPAAATSTQTINLGQSIETLNCYDLAGQTVTLSFWAKAGANFSAASNILVSGIYTGTGTDQNIWTGYTGSASSLQNNTLTTSWQKFTHTVTLSSSATEVAVAFFYTPTGTAGAADFYEVSQVQLEQGSAATSFEWLPYGQELILCQRYFETAYDITGLTWFDQAWFSGNVNNGATYYASVTFKVSKRTNSPTVTTFRLGESNFSTAAPTVGNATNVGFSANKAATNTNAGNFVFSYYVSNEL